MTRETFPGERELKAKIEAALGEYLDAWKAAASAPDADEEVFGDWEDHGDIMVGWVVGIQTLGHDEGRVEDCDGLIDVLSDGMSQYTAIGVTQMLAKWMAES